MVLFIEILELAILITATWRLIRWRPLDAGYGVIVFLGATLISLIPTLAIGHLPTSTHFTPLRRGTLTMILGALVFVVAFAWLRPRVQSLLGVKETPKSMGKTWKAFQALMGVGMLLLFAFLNDTLVNAYALVSAKSRQALGQSIFLKVFLETTVPTPPKARTRTGETPQKKLVYLLGQGWRSSRHAVAEMSGSNYIKKKMALIQELSGASPEELEALVKANPPLMSLSTHPKLLAIISDEALISKTQGFCNGSLGDFWELSGDPKIAALEGDAVFLKAMGQLDVETLHEQLVIIRANPKPVTSAR